MSYGKRLFQSAAVQGLLARVLSLYFGLVIRTTRWTSAVPEETAAILKDRQAYIGCFWHGRMTIGPAARPASGQDFYMLVSLHRDGALIGRTIEHLGIRTVSGSSKRGGAEALRQLQRRLDQGDAVGLTPDGPRGPRMRAKPGVIKVAQLSGAPIIPVSGAVRRRILMKSWDRFLLPLPFSRGVIFWGTPLLVPRHPDGEELERLRRTLEDEMNRLTEEADRYFGLTTVAPAPEAKSQDRQNLDHARA